MTVHSAEGMTADGCLTNARVASFSQEDLVNDPYGIVEDACVIWRSGKIVFVGPKSEADRWQIEQTIDVQGAWVLPGLIDCHTHLVYGGNRADEFEALRSGTSYSEIASTGGGIKRTVECTRSATEAELLEQARRRLRDWLRQGVTTIEIKSGYGLTVSDELKMLRVIKQLKRSECLEVFATCLAAHTVPIEYKNRAGEYLDCMINELLPQVAEESLADCVDVFCERIAFNTTQARRWLEAARSLGFSIKGHVEQLSQQRGTDLICELGGLSADHLEYADQEQAEKMAASGTVAVLLPGAFYYLNETHKPPIDAFRQHKVPMAIATDHNPGSSPVSSLLGAANLGSVLFGLTPAEALSGITTNAAKALGRGAQLGQLSCGYRADMTVWDIDHPRELVYQFRDHLPTRVYWHGQERLTC